MLQLTIMDSKDEFYVTLVSNVINNNFNNSISNFVTQLPSVLTLDSSWRVGLSEIHFTNSWCNLRTNNRVLLHDDFQKTSNSFTAINAGRYEDVEALLDEIRAKTQQTANLDVQRLPDLRVNYNTRRITMRLGATTEGDHVRYHFDPELAEMLGVSDGFSSSFAHTIVTLDDTVDVNPPISADDTFIAKRSYDLTGGIHSLFVYCDIVDYSIVGNTRAQLLRMAHIPAESKFGDSIVDRFESPHYLPLSTKEISSIEIDIKDDTNTPISFEFGRVKLVLHFKKWMNTI